MSPTLFLWAIYLNQCQIAPYAFDSYGRGVEAGYKNVELLPKIADPQCYEWGKQVGTSLKEQCQDSDFENGWQEGLTASVDNNAGSPCFTAGYIAGISLLDVCAREDCTENINPQCTSEYARGKTDARNHSPSSPTLENPQAHCYELGYFENLTP